jgi:hypothetical protein
LDSINSVVDKNDQVTLFKFSHKDGDTESETESSSSDDDDDDDDFDARKGGKLDLGDDDSDDDDDDDSDKEKVIDTQKKFRGLKSERQKAKDLAEENEEDAFKRKAAEKFFVGKSQGRIYKTGKLNPRQVGLEKKQARAAAGKSMAVGKSVVGGKSMAAGKKSMAPGKKMAAGYKSMAAAGKSYVKKVDPKTGEVRYRKQKKSPEEELLDDQRRKVWLVKLLIPDKLNPLGKKKTLILRMLGKNLTTVGVRQVPAVAEEDARRLEMVKTQDASQPGELMNFPLQELPLLADHHTRAERREVLARELA